MRQEWDKKINVFLFSYYNSAVFRVLGIISTTTSITKSVAGTTLLAKNIFRTTKIFLSWQQQQTLLVVVDYKKLDICRHTDEIGRIISTVTSLSSRCLDLGLPQTLTKVTRETQTWKTREVWTMSSHGQQSNSLSPFSPPPSSTPLVAAYYSIVQKTWSIRRDRRRTVSQQSRLLLLLYAMGLKSW